MRASIEEVKEYFKNAKEVIGTAPVYEKNKRKIDIETITYHKKTNAYYCNCLDSDSDMLLWSKKYGYAKIISYIEPEYKITKEANPKEVQQVLEKEAAM